MSNIPPDVIGPILQAGIAQRSAARALDNERGQQADADATGSKMNALAADSVGEADDDTQVFADSEGAGSQGRSDEDEQTESTAEDTSAKVGIREDDDGQLHVDLEA